MRSLTNNLVKVTAGLTLFLTLILTGCNTDAQHIREINEILATPAAERASLSAEIDYIDIQHGDCINSTLPEGISIETVVIVPCAGPWQYRVLSSFEVAAPDHYPGVSYFEQQTYERCNRRYSVFLYPLAESWRFGDRTVSCLQASFGLSVSDPAKLEQLVRAGSLGSGECFNEAPETEFPLVELVSCSDDWELRVLNSFEVADYVRYPGEDLFGQQAYQSCDRRYSIAFFPEAESWSLGDKTISCLQASFGLSVIDPAKLDRLVRAQSLRSGDCFNQAPETDHSLVELVSCSDNWELRVLNLLEVADSDRYPGEEVFSQQAYESCDPRYSTAFFPEAESWSLGDKTISCLQASFGLSVSDPAKLDRLVRAQSLRSGDCFNQAPETDYSLVEMVSCLDNWELRVLNSFEVADSDRYPGNTFFDQQAYERCDERHTTFFFPLSESWRLGDRMVICLQDSFGLSASDSAKLNRLMCVQALSSGDCFNEAPETNYLFVEVTSCAGNWQLQVTNTFVLQGDGPYPGGDYVQSQADQGCGTPSDVYFGPTKETWDLGDRKVICVAASASTSSQ